MEKIMQQITAKQELMRNIDEAIAKKKRHFTVAVTTEGSPGRELITNPLENLPNKRAYYDKAYDENLRLKANPDIRIVWSMSYNRFATLDAFFF